MLGLDGIRPELAGFIAGKEDDAPCPLGITFEHRPWDPPVQPTDSSAKRLGPHPSKSLPLKVKRCGAGPARERHPGKSAGPLSLPPPRRAAANAVKIKRRAGARLRGAAHGRRRRPGVRCG